MAKNRPGDVLGVEWPEPGPALPPGSLIVEPAPTRTPPLVVIPLPGRLSLVAVVMRAVADTWQEETGQTLTSEHMATEQTSWGEALVIRKPEPRIVNTR